MRRALISIALIAFFAAVVPGTAASPQKVADAQQRREAIGHFRAGQELMSGEKFDRAAEEFQQAIAIDPLFTLAHYSLGQAHMNLQRYASAIKAFKDCIEASRTLFGLAETNRFAVEKQREDEIHEMRESVKRLHALGPGYALRATRAEQQLRDLETQKPSLGRGFQPPAEALLSLGSAYFRIDERDQAEAEWRAAIEVNPRLGEAHNNLAVILMQTGRFDDAEREIKAAEKAGFRVNPQLKSDLKQAAGRR